MQVQRALVLIAFDEGGDRVAALDQTLQVDLDLADNLFDQGESSSSASARRARASTSAAFASAVMRQPSSKPSVKPSIRASSTMSISGSTSITAPRIAAVSWPGGAV